MIWFGSISLFICFFVFGMISIWTLEWVYVTHIFYLFKTGDTADQDADKSRTYDYCRMEYSHLLSILFIGMKIEYVVIKMSIWFCTMYVGLNFKFNVMAIVWMDILTIQFIIHFFEFNRYWWVIDLS